MQIFSPYLVIEDSSSRIHLKENKFRKGFFFFILRIFPFIHLFFTLGLVVLFAREIPGQAAAMLVAVSVIVITLLITRKYITEVNITRSGADITYNRFFKEVLDSLSISEADHLFCRVKRGKGGGLYYSLVLKESNKKKHLFTIPAMYMSTERRVEINDRLHTVTGLQVLSNR